jgi:radical SAM protein with 4Fe4S-binding SPASM domain
MKVLLIKPVSDNLNVVDPQGNIYPCGMWNKRIANLEEIDYKLKNIWNKPETEIVRNQILKKNCPNCWTPCEAYQSILGNLLRLLKLQ